MRSLKEGILACIGNTPLLRLTAVVRSDIRLFAKLEGANPAAGASRTGPPWKIIRDGIRKRTHQ